MVKCVQSFRCLNQVSVRSPLIVKLMSYQGHKVETFAHKTQWKRKKTFLQRQFSDFRFYYMFAVHDSYGTEKQRFARTP